MEKNFITLSRDFSIDEKTTGHMVVEIASSNLLIKFWLPVIIAVIGLLGTIGQPVLHSLGLLYAPEPYYRIDPNWWSYDKLNDKFNLRIALQPVHEEMFVKKSELGDWRLFLCVREKDEAIDFSKDKYKFIGGPFILKTIMEHSVKTDRDFTRKLIEAKKSAQCCIVLVHKSISVGDTFCPSAFGSNVVKVPRAVAVTVE